MYVAENTLRHASVEFVRYQRTNYARSMAQAFSNANPAQRFAFESVSKYFFDTLEKCSGKTAAFFVPFMGWQAGRKCVMIKP